MRYYFMDVDFFKFLANFDYLFLFFPLLFFFGWLFCFIPDKSRRKNGIMVEAIVKSIEETRDEENYLINKYIIVELDYNGHKELPIYNNCLDVKIGDKITCIYDPVKNTAIRQAPNAFAKKNSKIYFILLVISIFLTIHFAIFKYLTSFPIEENPIVKFSMYIMKYHNTLAAIVLFGLTILFPLIFLIIALIAYKKTKIKNKYVKVYGTVKDIIKIERIPPHGKKYYLYTPVLEFNYNNQTITYESNVYGPGKYKIGEVVRLYIDPTTNKVIEKKMNNQIRNSIFWIIMFFLFLLIMNLIAPFLEK